MITFTDNIGTEHKIFPENIASLGVNGTAIVLNGFHFTITSNEEAKTVEKTILKAIEALKKESDSKVPKEVKMPAIDYNMLAKIINELQVERENKDKEISIENIKKKLEKTPWTTKPKETNFGKDINISNSTVTIES